MVHYPTGKKNTFQEKNKISAGRRGQALEKDLNQSNQYYLDTNKAVIHKKPTPIQIVKVDYQSRSTAKITEAYFRIPSTTDYNGIYKGRYLDFEAKETRSRTLFPFKAIHPHQLIHLKQVECHGGIAFVIIRFVLLQETYLVEAGIVIEAYENKQHSLPLSVVRDKGYLLKSGYICPVDYLKAVDQLLLKGE